MAPNQYYSESQDIKDRAYALCGRKVRSLPSFVFYSSILIDHDGYSLTSRLPPSSLPNTLKNIASRWRHRLVVWKQRSQKSVCTNQHRLIATESSQTSHVHDQQQLGLSHQRLRARKQVETNLRIPSLMGPPKRRSWRHRKRQVSEAYSIRSRTSAFTRPFIIPLTFYKAALTTY